MMKSKKFPASGRLCYNNNDWAEENLGTWGIIKVIKQYKLTHEIETARRGEPADWLDLADPDEAEINQVAASHGLPPWFLSDPLDPKERPRIDQEGQALLIVVRLPVEEQREDGPHFHSVPVGIIICPGLLVTVCRRPDLVKEHLYKLYRRKKSWTCTRAAFALFRSAGTSFIATLERLEDLADQSETRLRRAPDNESLLALLNVEKALIDLTLALKSNHALMDKFHQAAPFGLELGPEDRDLLDDAITENQQAIFMAEIFSQILASMGDAFGSVISNNLNKIMKFMAGVTIVLMLPSIVAGLYGMNVKLPGAEAPGAFWFLCSICLGLMLVVSILFAKKKWF